MNFNIRHSVNLNSQDLNGTNNSPHLYFTKWLFLTRNAITDRIREKLLDPDYYEFDQSTNQKMAEALNYTFHKDITSIIKDSVMSLSQIYGLLTFDCLDVQEMLDRIEYANTRNLEFNSRLQISTIELMSLAPNAFWPECIQLGMVPQIFIKNNSGFQINTAFKQMMEEISDGGCPVALTKVINELGNFYFEVMKSIDKNFLNT